MNKMMKPILLAVACVAAALPAFALAQSAPPPPPREDPAGAAPPLIEAMPQATKLQLLLVRKETLILKSYTTIADMPGDDGSSLRVRAVRATDVPTQQTAQGIAIEVRDSPENVATAYVDPEEIDRLLAAIDELVKLRGAPGPLQEYDARYETRGGLEVANASTNGGRSGVVRTVEFLPATGQFVQAVAQVRVNRLAEFQQHLRSARELLDRAGATGSQQPAAADK